MMLKTEKLLYLFEQFSRIRSLSASHSSVGCLSHEAGNIVPESKLLDRNIANLVVEFQGEGGEISYCGRVGIGSQQTRGEPHVFFDGKC